MIYQYTGLIFKHEKQWCRHCRHFKSQLLKLRLDHFKVFFCAHILYVDHISTHTLLPFFLLRPSILTIFAPNHFASTILSYTHVRFYFSI